MSAAITHLEKITKFVYAREKFPRAAMFALQAVARETLGENRMTICYRYKIPEKHVEIWHSPIRQTAYYTGLMKCGMQWVCPLCSARLSEKRRDVLTKALDNSRDRYIPIMVTYTAQHDAGMRLSTLLNGMLEAYRKMRQSRTWKLYKEEYMIVGEVRALEITHGSAGWHPHFHTLMFLDIALLKIVGENGRYNLAASVYDPLRAHLTPEWIAALEKCGLTALDGPGLHVRGDWDQLDDYLTKSGSAMPKQAEKWTVATELTKSNRKKSRGDNLNVWDFLLMIYAGETRYVRLFKEYFQATKGKSQMQWTPGMLAKLEVESQSDDQLLDDQPDQADHILMRLSADHWRAILDSGAEGRLLDESAGGNWERIAAFLARIGVQVDSS